MAFFFWSIRGAGAGFLARAVFFPFSRKGGVLWAFSGAEKSAAGFLLESSFSAAEERQSCSCAVWFLCRKNKLQQQVFIQHKKNLIYTAGSGEIFINLS